LDAGEAMGMDQGGKKEGRRDAGRWGRAVQQWLVLIVGTGITALGYSLFQVPFDIAAGGVSGIGLIVNQFTGWPVGTFYLVVNIPLLVLGYFYLGGWRFLVKTLVAVMIFSAGTDLFNLYLPRMLDQYPVTDNMLLSAIYAGIVGGIGAGLIYRSGGPMGGTSIVGRIVQLKTGAPLSQVFLYTDGAIVVTAGLVFGWEAALYAMLTLFLSGLASDYTLEGPSSVRTATIITDKPQVVAQALIEELGRGVSEWQITGMYTGEPHSILFCTVYRPQVGDLKRIMARVDRDAFVVIGTAHQALGYGFMPLK
jgi:uncharacterized membrane-anchored protein YitT (DUF2179 family)